MLCAVPSSTAPVSGRYRYGLVLSLTIVAVVDVIVAPDTPVSRGIGVLLQGTMLLVVIATSRGDRDLRWVAGALATAVLLALSLGVALSLVPIWLGSTVAGLSIVAVLVVLVRGVVRLIREQGVGVQAVAGALAIYMLVGLTFALLISFVAHVGPTYFAQGKESLSEQVYFSFTTMTTTGYGDLTPATRVGHALAVLEMLIGQIYLVTVIGLLVGNLNRRSPSPSPPPSPLSSRPDGAPHA
jgi:hypothetical protein